MIAPQTTISPRVDDVQKRDSAVREALRAVFDVVMLAEPAQTELWQSQGLTLTQLGAIRALAGGPLPAGKLADRLAISPTSLTRVLDRLEARGLVARTREDPDRRVVTIGLLPTGSGLLDGISVLAGTAMHEAVAAMSGAEREQLLASARLLARLTRQRRVARARAAEQMVAEPQRASG
jgi:DNA-binding MarR family transcriptional regulator